MKTAERSQRSESSEDKGPSKEVYRQDEESRESERGYEANAKCLNLPDLRAHGPVTVLR